MREIKKEMVNFWIKRRGIDPSYAEDAMQEAYLLMLEGDPCPEGNAVRRIFTQKYKRYDHRVNLAKHSTNIRSQASMDRIRGSFNYYSAAGCDFDIPVEPDAGDPEIIEIIKKHGTPDLVKVCELLAYTEWLPNRRRDQSVDGYLGCGKEHEDRDKKIAAELGYYHKRATPVRIERIRKILEEQGYDPVS